MASRIGGSFSLFSVVAVVVLLLFSANFSVRKCAAESGHAGEGAGASSEHLVDEKDVVILGAENFTNFVNTNPYVLVEFYAPWCGHCQSLAPEWASAASILKGDSVPLAKVDATVHAELAKEFGVQGYPTILFFIDGLPKRYTGERVSDGIVMWVKKKTGPAIDFVKSESDAEELLLQVDTPLAVAFLENFEGKDAEELTAVARQEDGILFYMTSDADVAKIFSLNKNAPALVLWKKENEKLSTFGIMNLLQNHDIILQPNMRVNHYFSSPRLNIF
jgi:protein disulfide-isomerase A1